VSENIGECGGREEWEGWSEMRIVRYADH